MDETPNKDRAPPRIAGDISIARFPDSGATERWRVSLLGKTHFLTDNATAHRILALAPLSPGSWSYQDAYHAYRYSLATSAESFESYVRWCETHRSRLEQLAGTPDSHPLRLRRLLLDAPICNRIGVLLSPIFRTGWIYVLWCVALSIITVYLLFKREVALDSPNFWLAAGLTLVGVLIHEFGHITACVRYGARQGGIGFGLYWIWPAFYADVRGSWVLTSKQRTVVSLGGLYFQSLYVATLAANSIASYSATLELAINLSLLLMATTLNPVFKYDGYWIVSDLLNITNLHTRIEAHLRALVGAGPDERRTLLSTRMTGLSVSFAVVAGAYVAYVFYAMAVAGMHITMRLPELWTDLAMAVGESPLALGSLSLASARLGSHLLQLALVIMGTILLGFGSVHCAMRLLPSR